MISRKTTKAKKRRGETILLVDDDREFRKMVRILLETSGFKVLESSCGKTGLLQARRRKPDIILLDLMLPHLNGLLVARLLKFDRNYQHIPIVMVSSSRLDTHREDARNVRINAFMEKPFRPDQLLETIGRISRDRGRSRCGKYPPRDPVWLEGSTILPD